MRIVHVEDFFHPEAGYQINVLTKYQARAGNEVIIVTSEMDKIPEYLTSFFGKDSIQSKDELFSKKNNIRIIRYPIRRYFSGRSIFKRGFKKMIDGLKPDMLFVHGDGTWAALEFIRKYKKLKYGVIFDSHMLEMASVNPLSGLYRFFYRCFFTPIIKKNKLVFIRTQDDRYVEKCLGIPLEQAPFISHATDDILFQYNSDYRDAIREQYGIQKNETVVIYAGKMVKSKGVDLLIDAFRERFNTKKDIVLFLVGNISGEFGELITERIKESQNRIVVAPTQKYNDLAMYYSAADIAVFPKQCSLSFYDVQACGLPVVEEDNNINHERLSHGNGFCFAIDDVNDFRKQLEVLFNMPDNELQTMKKNAIEYVEKNYSYSTIYKKYEEIITSEYIRQKRKQ